LSNDAGVVHPILDRWRSFSRIDSESRSALVWTALIYTSGSEADHPAPLPTAVDNPGEALETDARTLKSFLANLPAGRALSSLALERMFGIFAASGTQRRIDRSLATQAFVQMIARLGVLLPASRGEQEWFAPNPYLRSTPDPEARPVVVEPNFQLTLKPSVGFADGLAVASMAEIRRFDVYPRYEITKRSFIRAIEGGSSAQELMKHLETLGESELPQNIRFTLTSWEREFRGLSLYRGIVLTADPERRHLIEHSEAMRPWILRTLAPGVYLLDERGVVDWSRALARSGIDPLPSIRDGAPRSGESAGIFRSFGRPSVFKYPTGDTQRERVSQGGTNDLAAELSEELAKLDLSPELSSELGARITKKLILFRKQLEQTQLKFEKNEAKGLDYVGKVRLVEQALKSGSELLEVLERTPKGSTRRLLVRPIEVRKSGNELVLHAQTLPENESVEIKIRKIGLVRKLKSSLYAP
ncbi:MAG TPA: hypothetical protein VMW69_14295, partial [Spirochaetia bacterium]|nr:hypothetical protein [Spirochaetia bacterium]